MRHALGSAIVLLDSGPIRRKRLGVYRRLKRALEKARAEEERFEREDVPAFRAWQHKNFGERLSRIRDLEAEAEEKEWLVEAVRMEVAMGGGSYSSAYRRVLKEREAEEAEEDDDAFSSGFREEEDRTSEPEEEDDFFANETDFVEFFADVFFQNAFSGEFENEAEEAAAREAFHRSIGLKDKNPRQPDDLNLKEMYRRLARRLHPDKNPSAGRERLELWHELQNAYAEGDLNAILRIEAKCDLHDRTVSDHTAISLINDVIEETREMLRAVRSFLRKAKKEPAWDFSRGKCNTEALTLAMESSLWQREAWLRRLLLELEATLKQWSERPRRKRKPKRRRQKEVGSSFRGRQDSPEREKTEAGPFQIEFPF